MEMIVGAVVFSALLLVDILAGSFKKPRVFSMSEMGISLICIVLTYTTRFLPFVVVTQLLVHFAGAYKGALSGTPLWLALPVIMVLDDYSNYWLHRLAHKVPVLWRFHKPHHTPTQINVVMSSRENIFYYLIIPVNYYFPLFLFLGLGEAAALQVAIKITVIYLQHTGYRWDLWLRRYAPMRWLLTGAEQVFALQDFHHVHHGLGRYGKAAANYGNVLCIWDRLHGTSVGQPYREQDAYGVPTGVKVEHWAVQVFWPLVRDPKSQPVTMARLQASSKSELAAAAAVIHTVDGLSIAVQPV